jgi:diguanylate cyclase (GGDEF)-like protein
MGVLAKLRNDLSQMFPFMVDAFLQDTPARLQAMQFALANGDSATLKEEAHSIKGSSLNLGAQRLAGLCKRVEEMAGEMGVEGAAEPVSAVLESLVDEFGTVRAVLENDLEPGAERPAHAVAHGPTVLIADDDRATRMALADLLEQDGYHIHEAMNGAHAVSVCEREMPDLVLMDAVMPTMGGFAACKRIRELPGSEHLPVLIVTALDDPASVTRAFAAGATDYVPKPVNFAVLRQRVAHLLSESLVARKVHRLAYHDALTGVPNRTLFRQRLGELLTTPRAEQEGMALLYLDLDRFKGVNDCHGHDVGDLLLHAAAERIQACVRAGDMVARIGGDEFTVVLQGVRAREAAASVAEKVCHALARPFVLAGQEVCISGSVGIALYPEDAGTMESLVRAADLAMFSAKEQGNRYCYYEAKMETAVMPKALREALVTVVGAGTAPHSNVVSFPGSDSACG